MKTASRARITTTTLAETYLGRDAARQVLTGRILRGVRRPMELFTLDPGAPTPMATKLPSA